LNQKNFPGAIRYIFKAISLNPFFPYNNLIEYRQAFNKKFSASISQRVSELNIEDHKMTKELKEKYMALAEELSNRQEYARTPSFEEIIMEIRKRANSTLIDQEIELKLSENFCDGIVCPMIRGELLRYFPKGTDMHEAIYIERIPEVLDEFEKILKLDPNFILMHTRIGTLMMVEAAYKKDAGQAELGMKRYLQGIDAYISLGMHM
jgi:tetratricopeptide (TPR) repeat protein